MPSLSVLVTYYNEGVLLRECLDSLLDGSDLPDEIIVYDDASPDIPAREVIGNDLPVHIIRGEENVGPSRGRNRLLDTASGDYVHFHDADDLFEPEWYRRIQTALAPSDAESPDLVLTEITSKRAGDVVARHVVGFSQLQDDTDLLRFCVQHPILQVCGTYRRSLLNSIGGYRTDLWQAEDYDLHIRLALQNPDYTCIQEPMATIRLRPGGRSRSNRDEVARSIVQIGESLREELPQSYHNQLAEKVAWAGSLLYRHATPSEAKRAFDLAYELGPPNEFQGKHGGYRLLARTAGPLAAEKVSDLYRQLLPEGIRRLVPRG